MNALSSEFDRLKNLSDEEIKASARAQNTVRAEALAHQRTAEQATQLIAEAHTTNMRKLTPSEMRSATKEGLTGAVGFEHTHNYTENGIRNTNRSLVFMTPDPASGTVQVRVSGHNNSIDGGSKNVNGAFSITADGKFENGSLKKSDQWHKAILDDTTTQANNGLNLRNTPGSFSEKVEQRWISSEKGKQIAATTVAGIAADQPGITAPKAVEIGNALTGAEPGTGVKVDQDVLTKTAAERETAHLLQGEAKLGQTAEHASLAGKFGKAAGKVVLPLGVAFAVTEANAKDGIAQEAVTQGRMPPEALNQYRGIQAAQLTTLADPTVVGGEMAVQKTYATFADEHHLDPQLREALRPSALSDLVPEVKPITLDQKQQAFFDTFDRLPDKVQPGMPPEVESLVEAKGMVRQGEANLTTAQNASPGATDKTRSLSEAQRGLDTAQSLYQEQYDTLEKSGQLKETVEPWLEANTASADAKPPTPATPEPTTPDAKAEEKYTVKPPTPAPAPA
jgi:hypothetical protein